MWFLEIAPNLRLGRSFELENDCHSADVYLDKIYIGCQTNDRKGHVVVMDMNGAVIAKHGKGKTKKDFWFKGPDYIAVRQVTYLYRIGILRK